MEAPSDVIHAIYETALLPERWPETLSKIGAVFRAEGAAIVFYTGNERTDLIYSSVLHDDVHSYIGEGWWKHDILAQRMIFRHIKHGDVVDDYALATQDEIDNHPIYVEHFRRFGLG